MTGIVHRIMGKKSTFCFIRATDGTEFFAHSRDFINPETMKVGELVKFTPVTVLAPGRKTQEAMNVESHAA